MFHGAKFSVNSAIFSVDSAVWKPRLARAEVKNRPRSVFAIGHGEIGGGHDSKSRDYNINSAKGGTDKSYILARLALKQILIQKMTVAFRLGGMA